MLSVGNWEEEPYFEDEAVAELGFSLENQVFSIALLNIVELIHFISRYLVAIVLRQ